MSLANVMTEHSKGYDMLCMDLRLGSYASAGDLL